MMDSDEPELPKFRLREQAGRKEKTEPLQPIATSTEENAKKPLELREASELTLSNDEPMDSTANILDQAYGAINKARARRDRISSFYRGLIVVATYLSFFAATLAFAHVYKRWPILEPAEWYLPFFISAAISAWLCLKSITFCRDRSLSLAIFGIFLAGLTAYWNIYLLEYATNSSSSNVLWTPENVDNLLISSEFSALRGIPESKAAYTQLPQKSYHEAFYSIPRNEWRPYFQIFLSREELENINVLNIHDYVQTVSMRMHEKRGEAWDALQEEIKQPSLEFRIRQTFLEPYLWLLHRL